MKKHIRPISAFKKQHPEIYALAMGWVDPGSKKDMENAFYRIYAHWFSEIDSLEGEEWNPFFYQGQVEVNKSIVTEMGRLMLAGWYYNVEPFCVEVCQYVYNSRWPLIRSSTSCNSSGRSGSKRYGVGKCKTTYASLN